MSPRTSSARTLQPGNGYRLPPEAYYAQDWFVREQRQLFRRTWNFVGETRDLREPGDYLTAAVGGSPILVLRDAERQLRAFHNLCRHRGAKLLDGVGNCSAISCPYHRWRYRLDGSLDNVPQQAEQLPDLDPNDWGLLPVSLAEWQGLLFVNPDDQAAEFSAWLADIPAILGAFEPDRLQPLTEGVFEFNANWKFYIENHVDWYHLWYTHPQTLRMWDHHDGRMLQPGAHLLFPNLTLFTGEGYFATGLVTPLGPDHARMHFRALVAAEQALTPELAAGMLRAFREITEVEDAGMTERLQATVQSDAFAVGPMSIDHEAPIARLHDEYLAVFEA